jgi:hypothetical protein
MTIASRSCDGSLEKGTELVVAAIGPTLRNPIERSLLRRIEERWSREEE